MSKFFIYALHHDESDHVYIGKSLSGMRRPNEHGRPAYMKRHAWYPIIQWINKLKAGGKKYKITLLEEYKSGELLDEAERFYIGYFRSIGMSLLNITGGGEGMLGHKMSEETKSKISKKLQIYLNSPEGQAMLRNRPPRGAPSIETTAKRSASLTRYAATSEGHAHMLRMSKNRHTPEMEQKIGPKISSALTGRKLSLEHRQKMSLVNKGCKRSPESIAKTAAGNRGKKRSLEFRQKQSARLKGKKLSLETIARISAAKRGQKQSPESIAKRVAANRGKKRTPEQIARMVAGRHAADQRRKDI